MNVTWIFVISGWCWFNIVLYSCGVFNEKVGLPITKCWMNEWIRGRPSIGPCTATVIDLLCVPLYFNPPTVLHFEWSVVSYLQGHLGSHLVPWNNGPGDEILSKLWPHTHIGCVWHHKMLIRHCILTSHIYFIYLLCFFFGVFSSVLNLSREQDKRGDPSPIPPHFPSPMIATGMVPVEGNNTDKNSRHNYNKTQQACIQKIKTEKT
jgi:hypothetical protein